MPEKSLRDDLTATIAARRDLGPEYEAELVDAFMDRLDATIAARVRAELDHRLEHREPSRSSRQNTGSPMVPITLGSLGIGVPLTAVAAGGAGAAGVLMTWLAIIVLNVFAAVAIMRRP